MTTNSQIQPLTPFQGKWIVVEGPDRIGKTTLIRNLQSRITAQGINVMTNGFPRRKTLIGTLLDHTLKSRDIVRNWKAQTLLFLSDMLEAQEEMKSWVEPVNGSGTVITDRYVASTYAYAKAQRHLEHTKYDEDWLNKAISMLPQPDVYVVLIPEDDNIDFLTERSEFGGEVTERADIQQRVVKNITDYTTRLAERLLSFPPSLRFSIPQVVKVVVGKDDSPETICDKVVMTELSRLFAISVSSQKTTNKTLNQTQIMTDPYNEALFDELVVPRSLVEYERNPRSRNIDTASTMPDII